MKNLRETCIDFLKSEDMKREVRDIIKPIGDIVYNELYFYIWFICIYNIILIFIVLAILCLLLRNYSIPIFSTIHNVPIINN